MEVIMTGLTTFFTSAVTMIGDLAGVIAEQPVLQIMCIGVPIVGVACGYLGRLFRT